MRRVKIKSLPKAAKGGAASLYQQIAPSFMSDSLSKKPLKGKNTLEDVGEEEANVEVENGEIVDILNLDGLPMSYIAGGKRHSQGGTKINVPENSFIFSDTPSMKIKDQSLLKYFGMPEKKSGYTPAEIANKFDYAPYRKNLMDPSADKMTKETAERMMKNYSYKKGFLSLVQEGMMKGFPDGIPDVAMPFMAMSGVQPQDLLPLDKPKAAPQGGPQNPSEAQFVNEQTNPLAMRFGGRIASKIKDNPLLGKVYKELGGSQKRFNPESGIFMVMESGGPVYYDGNGTKYSSDISDVDVPGYFANGGTVLPTFKDGAQASNVAASKDATSADVPADKIKDINDPTLAVGDYYKDADGKTRKVTKMTADPNKVQGQTKSGKDYYKPTYGSLEEDVIKANEIMKRLEDAKLAVSGKDGWTIYKGAAGNLTVAEKDFLTGLASYNISADGKNLGAPGFKVASQSSYEDASRKKKVDDGFYGFADPQMVEFRYWQAQNPDKPATDFDSLDDATKLDNRQRMLRFYGYTPEEIKGLGDKINDPTKLYTKDFISNKEKGLVKRNQERFEQAGYRTQHGNDYKFGLEHLDKFTFGKTPEGEEVIAEPGAEPNTDINNVALDAEGNPAPDTPWWLQDVIRTTGAAGDMARIKKRLPWAPKITPYIGTPTFYDPTRELASAEEQFRTGVEGAAAFAGPQSYNARFAQMSGQGAKAAADIMGRYNNLNVGEANNFEATKAQIFNAANATNAQTTKDLFDQTAIANQQYDNSKNQTRQELRSAYIDAITNKAKTQTLNEVYGENYMVDPSQGGYTMFTKGSKMTPADMAASKIETFKSLRSQFPSDINDNTILKLMGETATDDPAASFINSLNNAMPGAPGMGPYYTGT